MSAGLDLLSRKQLRQLLREKRRQLSPSLQSQHARSLCKAVTQQLWFQRAKHIALYLPNDGEIDTSPLIQHCWKLKKQVYLPVLHPVHHNRLWFLAYTPSTKMRLNTYRIQEPSLSSAPIKSAWALDLVFLPLVGFNQKGGRLGMGGGYYDRTFDFKLRKRALTGPKLIGLAHSIQQADCLTNECWDVPLNCIATEKDILIFNDQNM